MPEIAVVGTGMAGCGAAYRLHTEGITPVVYDKNTYHGGHTASFRVAGGFLFDVGPHISYTKDPRIQNLFADSVDQQYNTLQIYLNNYWNGCWPKHPVQLHLHGLPEDVIIKVISDFVDIRQVAEKTITNYADWLISSFGHAFAGLFPMKYTRKYHTTSAENLTTDWMGPRIYRPSLEEVLRGALSPTAPQVHYITHFRYPCHGGFVSYLRKFIPLGNIKLNHQIVSIDPWKRLLTFSTGVVAHYDALISSIPLPVLVRMIQGTPQSILDASSRLACSSCVLVNLGVNREDLSRAHVTYFYDEDICFSRAGFPHMLAPTNAPAGTGTIQVEIYYSKKYRPFIGAPDDCIEPVISDLRRCGLLRDEDQILFRSAMLLPYANIIFDQDRAAALTTVHGYLDDIGIAYCGRYGEWGYLWTDDSFKSGEAAAQRILDRTGHPAGHAQITSPTFATA